MECFIIFHNVGKEDNVEVDAPPPSFEYLELLLSMYYNLFSLVAFLFTLNTRVS